LGQQIVDRHVARRAQELIDDRVALIRRLQTMFARVLIETRAKLRDLPRRARMNRHSLIRDRDTHRVKGFAVDPAVSTGL
ncbi:MAG: hypothetical protein ACXVDD_25085, partial [Polyangia bacterium]